MRIAFTLPVLLLGFAPASDDLGTRYEAGKAVRIETRTSFRLELTETTRDGKPIENPRGGRVEETLTSVVVDRWQECTGGRPNRVRRTFEEASGEAKLEVGETVQEQAIESPFQGLVVELARGEDGAIEREVVEGDAPADEALERLGLELDLDRLLPEDDIALGATWDLEAGEIRRALMLDLAEVLFPLPEEDEEGGGERQRPFFDAEWTGTAKYTGDEEREGEACRVVEIELDCTRETEESHGSTTFEARLHGRLYLSIERSRPAALEVEGSASIAGDFERERRGRTTRIHRVSAGAFECAVVIEETDFEED